MFSNVLSKNINYQQFLEVFLSMLESGLHVPVILRALEQEDNTKRFVNKINNKIDLNDSFCKALCSIDKRTAEYEEMLLLAEETGNIVPILKNVVEEIKIRNENKRNIITVCLYPVLIVVLAISMSVVLLNFGIPYITQITLVTGTQLKNGVFLANSWLCVSVLILIVILFLLKNRYLFQFKFFRNLHYMVLNKISLERALEIIVESKGFTRKEKNVVLNLLERIRNGESFNLISKELKTFDIYTQTWLSVTNENGDLQNSFSTIYAHYKKEHEKNTETVMRMIEPGVIIITGVYILILVIKCIVPIFISLGENLF